MPLTEASLLSVAEALREIGGRESEVRAWLDEQGLIRETRLGKRILWGDVLRAYPRQGELPPLESPPPPRTLPRVRLGKGRDA